MFRDTTAGASEDQLILVININDKAMECPGMLSEEKVINECETTSGGTAAAYFKSTRSKNKLLQQQLSVQSSGGGGGTGGGGGGDGRASGGVGSGNGPAGGANRNSAKKHGASVDAQFRHGGSLNSGGITTSGGHVNKRGKYSSATGGKLAEKSGKSNSVPDDQDDFLDSSFDPVVVGGGGGGSGSGAASGEPGAARLIKVPSETGMDEVRSRHDGSVGKKTLFFIPLQICIHSVVYILDLIYI